MSKKSSSKNKADQYNDPSHNYLEYWHGRDYEHGAEEIAVRRLLNGKKFKNAIDIGGGYGRLSVLLEEFSDKVTLAEPSQQQLDLAKEYLKGRKNVSQKLMQADDLAFGDGTVDLAAMVRVMHHLPDPSKEFAEISRVLTQDGVFILELANYAHARNRLKHMVRGQRLPVEPVDIRSKKNQRSEEIPFVNHNPKTVVKQLAHAGLRVEKVLSVSNLRSPALKRVMPRTMMLSLEKLLQTPLSSLYFGPSIFFLVQKTKTAPEHKSP